MAHWLNHRALHPSNLKKINASLNNSKHHESTSAKTTKIPPQKHKYFFQTVNCIDLIIKKWNILQPHPENPSLHPNHVVHTCKTLANFAEYLLHDPGFEEVQMGRVQSDENQRRFEMYRLTPIYESEKIIRVQALMKYSNLSLSELLGVFMDFTEDRKEQIH
ncbi:hypothetical protein TCAL_15649, partial [Tigriopus californicus]